MRQVINTEVKDIRSANQVYAIELERNQALFRELQKETMENIDERKEQNNMILESTRELVKK